MEQPLFVLVALFLVSSCKGQSWTAPDFCHQQKCPQFTVVEANQDFEERLYVATDWITTKIESSDDRDVMAAHSRLKDYCQKQQKAGYEISADTWPGLITVKEGEDGSALTMSWFVPPGTTKPENTDELVTLQSRPEATVYVRVFGGFPSITKGQDNAKFLRDALAKAGKTFDPNTYSGAGYDSYFSLTHHNEIWISAA
ncbi:heme-binding protein soul2 [Thunnus maccoyii]|uniref:heme-binding protein soul2 n=1 Tax=Thunnus maccoyii TaxID=8240 RepID=UPI001C4D513F|nr:heme-binding protein soul2 [Thunnus maccoyii]XP_042289701.1 heme-binding protein soul2 [Thunnus maccoyii]XP_042289702.1 heme-binding protein soul2 [Thunnus maccoyii]XP_042289703.1 heme-binding protein soul2 [Thunnus maccoyii]